MILIISWPGDEHAGPVLRRLQRAGTDVRLLDLAAFPQHLDLSIDLRADGTDATITGAGIDGFALSDCDVVWWRRPRPFEPHPELEGVDRQFAYREAQAAFDGLWSMTDATWVNDPTRDTVAARKVYQLQLARELGFEIPATRVTNDVTAAHSFVAEHGPESTVYKAFTGTEHAWRETRVLRPDELSLLDSVAYAPTIFQEYVPAGTDLRVTVMGETLFTGAIDTAATSYETDFRVVMEQTRVEPFELPAPVRERVTALVERLGLVYGAIDMRRTPDGRFVFLEINPSGQWQFVERDTGYPMTETFADLLASYDRAAG